LSPENILIAYLGRTFPVF